LKNTRGFTLVEALLAMAIVLFVVVSILSGFTQQMVSNRYAGAKHIAISLAEAKIEKYLKFPASQMPADSVDYVVEQNRKLVVSTVDPDREDQYRRTTVVTPSPDLAAMNVIRVTVEYGRHAGRYPFRVVLSSQRGG
jgi:type II secretory pathway pseudopilin PulG